MPRVNVYKKDGTKLGEFNIYESPLPGMPEYVMFGGDLFKLLPKHDLIQNDCYELVAREKEILHVGIMWNATTE